MHALQCTQYGTPVAPSLDAFRFTFDYCTLQLYSSYTLQLQVQPTPHSFDFSFLPNLQSSTAIPSQVTPAPRPRRVQASRTEDHRRSGHVACVLCDH